MVSCCYCYDGFSIRDDKRVDKWALDVRDDWLGLILHNIKNTRNSCVWVRA